MTEVRDYLDSRNEQLMTIQRKKALREYCLGACDYERRGVDCESISIVTLYEKLCCGQYDTDFQETYIRMYSMVADFVRSPTMAAGRQDIEKLTEATFLPNVVEQDETFHSHVESEHPVPNEAPELSKKETLALVWLLYVAERGVDS